MSREETKNKASEEYWQSIGESNEKCRLVFSFSGREKEAHVVDEQKEKKPKTDMSLSLVSRVSAFFLFPLETSRA
jgi:hypothetical protein